MGGEFESAKDLEEYINRIRQELNNPKQHINPYMGTSFLPFTFIKERLVYREMEGLVEGRVVHFVLDNHVFTTNPDKSGKQQTIEGLVCRPAIIVNAWGGKLEDGMINIQVLLDGSNDARLVNQYVLDRDTNQALTTDGHSMWLTSVKYSEAKEVGTWHWPERS